jgi:archaemetzincin
MAGDRLTVSMHVDIVPIGEVPADVKRHASAALRSVYDAEVTVADEQPIPEGAFDASRGQYRAEQFIEVTDRAGRGEKNIAVTTEDIYYRRRNYVFGLAYLNGAGSVISTHRLRTSSDGGVSNKPAAEVFEDRVRKEAVHEIGHTLGLDHCDNNRCVMSFSPTVREVDVKEEHLCGSCSTDVR